MSLDWGGVTDGLASGGFGLILAGLVMQATAGASLRVRPRTAALGVGLLGLGLVLLDAANEGPVTAVGQLAGAALLAPVLFVRNRFTTGLMGLSGLLVVVLYVYGRWNEGQLEQALWMVTLVVGAPSALIMFFWLRKKLQNSDPRRDAHA